MTVRPQEVGESAQPEDSVAPTRLLVVDDLAPTRATVAAVLRPPRFEVTEAATGKQALALVSTRAFDLVLLDIMMPDLNGLEVLEALRQSQSGLELPVIMMTARDNSSDVVKALQLGANDYVTKPIDFPVFFARIQAQIARKQADDALREIQAQLESRVEARTAEWVQANAALRQEIAERKRTEQALRKSEERYALAMQGANEGLWDWSVESGDIHVSPHVNLMLGTDPATSAVTRYDWEARLHPDDIALSRDAFLGHLRGETEFYHCEVRVLGPDGEYRWVLVRGLGVRDESGRVSRMAGSIGDITERKRARMEREKLESQLRQAQKMEAVGTLAGGIAHDFNNILGAILGYTELAIEELAEDRRTRGHLERVLAAGERAKHVVDQLLTFGRRTESERTPVELAIIVNEAAQLLRASLPSTIELNQSISAQGVAALVDATQVQQVILNLCTNAAQAMPSGGTVDLNLDPIEVDDDTAMTRSNLAQGSYLRLTVSDTGCGMDAATVERIFEPFFTTKGVSKGTGLGLSMVHGIVTDHGGAISVYSEPGLGTTFHVYLPRADGVESVTRAKSLPIRQGNGETVLLVDDEEPLVELGEEILAALGYEPVGFTSSLKALDAFRAAPDRFDLVVTDQTMPKMTGLELAERLLEIRPGMPIILATGHSGTTLSEKAGTTGIAEVLKKPLMSRDLAASISRVIDGREGQAV